ncbi:unannotated protein [freshwater metagenome]|uniref:Unannotated protein n=1 Tax=freshwater metagenome TaxID=449393 RepID=A0A6J7FLE8_9ZZZZ|nr:hypothetical protein [Actinomycetota bacterium]
MIENALDIAIALLIYIPSIALIVWAVDRTIEASSRRNSRREAAARKLRARRAAAAVGLQVADEQHLELLVLAGVTTPAQLIGAPREAAAQPLLTARRNAA